MAPISTEKKLLRDPGGPGARVPLLLYPLSNTLPIMLAPLQRLPHPRPLLPQDLCTRRSRCLLNSSSVIHLANALIAFRSLPKCYLLSGTVSDHLILKWQALSLLYFSIALVAFLRTA